MEAADDSVGLLRRCSYFVLDHGIAATQGFLSQHTNGGRLWAADAWQRLQLKAHIAGTI